MQWQADEGLWPPPLMGLIDESYNEIFDLGFAIFYGTLVSRLCPTSLDPNLIQTRLTSGLTVALQRGHDLE